MLYDKDKIEALRVARKLSGNELAKRAGISGPSMHAILGGRTKNVRFSTMAGIAQALGVPVQQIQKTPSKLSKDIQADAAIAFSQLNDSNKQAILATMLHLASQQKK